jgi:hypothetical protein
MRHVVNERLVARMWIEQSQDHARNRTGSFYFNGKTIYSYGGHFPIAKIDNENRVIFFTRKDYSNTTSKHKSIVSSIIPSSYRMVYSDCINYVPGDSIFLNKVLGGYLLVLEDLKRKCLKSLNNFRYVKDCCGHEINHILKFLEIYKFEIEQEHKDNFLFKCILAEKDIFTYGENCGLEKKQKRIDENNKIYHLDSYFERGETKEGI